ncbi:MAG: hypothetical protein V4534_04955 [Myxococcota bacterium]
MLPNQLKCLYSFKNTNNRLFEMQRLDLPDTRPPSERFQWFRYQEQPKDTFEPLHFEGMGETANHVQWRQFKEGRLEFDKQGANFIPTQGTGFAMEIASEPLTDKLLARVTQFFTRVANA